MIRIIITLKLFKLELLIEKNMKIFFYDMRNNQSKNHANPQVVNVHSAPITMFFLKKLHQTKRINSYTEDLIFY